FGDGDSSNVPIPSHIYSKDGVFSVTLIVSDGKYFDTLTRKSYIKVVMPLQASFETSNNIGEAPFRVQFSNTSTGEINGYKWSFGDGDSSTFSNPRHTYKKAGDFTVKLTVTDGINSSTYTKDKFINITAHPEIKSKYVLDTLWKITQDDFINYKDFGSIPTISCFEYNPNESNLVLSLFTKKDKQINYLTSINSKTGVIELNRVHSEVYSGITFTKDSNEIIGANNLLRMYDFKTLESKYIDNNSSNITYMNYNPNINVLTTTASDAARIYDTKKKTKINTILSVKDDISSDYIIKFFQSNYKKYYIKGAQSLLLAYGTASNKLIISDSNYTNLYFRSFDNFNPFRSLSMSSDNLYLAYQNINNGIDIFSLKYLSVLDQTSNLFPTISHATRFSNDDSKLFIKDDGSKFYILDLLTMETQRVLENISVNSFVLDPFDKDIIYLKSQANTIYALKIRVEKSITSIDDNQVISNNNPPFSPNPVKDKLHLKINEFKDSELIQILDMNGRKILETELKETIDVSNLIKGFYFLKIGNKEWKFLKE
ncbi:MAG: PKD domain-containing protein, partial [Candidatus Kapabacteria bacterium]|nr:PKD domain-containing protein [Candidatus Kapabacteria bacterium]